jgi:hypothetical protein
LIETAMKDSCAIMKLVGDKALDLQDRQVSCDCADAAVVCTHRKFLRMIYSAMSIAFSMHSSKEARAIWPQHSHQFQPLQQSSQKLQVSQYSMSVIEFTGTTDRAIPAKAQALWTSAKEKQHYESALSHAIELTQQSSPGGSTQEMESVKLLEQKRSRLKQQVQNELSLRDRALLSHASIVQSLYEEARARLQHIPADLLLHLPNMFISDAFERDVKALFKAGEQIQLVKQSPVAMLGEVSRVAPSLAAQDAVFVAMHHAESVSVCDTANVPHFLIHFNKIKWLFEQFSFNQGNGLPPVMSKSKFIECTKRVCCSSAPENQLMQLYDALIDVGDMTFHHFCCAFLHSECPDPVSEVQSIPFFGGDDNLFHLGGSNPSIAVKESSINSDSQVFTSPSTSVCSGLSHPRHHCLLQVSVPSVSEVRSLQDSLSSPNRLRLKMKAITFFESAMHLHQYTTLKNRNAPPPSPAPSDASGRCSPDGKFLSFSDFLQLAPDDLRSYQPPKISSPVRLRSIVGLSNCDS